MNVVSIFDSLYTFLSFCVEILKNIVYGLRMLPQLITDGYTILSQYNSIFPAFLWFLIMFAFGYGIIRKLLHWGE